jgi:hypothetical protein
LWRIYEKVMSSSGRSSQQIGESGLMKIGARLVRSICSLLARLGRGRVRYMPMAIPFPNIDVLRLRRDLDLDAEGAKMGALNLPTAGNTELDDVEQRIVTMIESARGITYHTYLGEMRTYADRLRSLQIQVLLQQAAATGEETRTALDDSLIRGSDRLFGLQRRLAELNREMEGFRSENGLLNRAVKMPDSRVFHWGVIALLLVIEASLNGNFLAHGLELGPLEGVVEALLIALLNVGSGLATGWFILRQLNHRTIARRILSILGLFLYACFAIGFNLLVAHYRDALGGPTPEDAGSLALRAFLAKPPHVADINSCLLLAMGIGFSLIALADGYLMDDPYPGYGRLARYSQTAQEDFREAKEEETRTLSELKDGMLRRLDQAASTIERRRADHHAVLQRRDGFRQQFTQHLDHLEQAANQLLSWYRHANLQARSAPAPEHFSQRWTMIRPNLGGTPEKEAGSSPFPDVEGEHVLNQLRETRREILDAYAEAIHSYATIEDLSHTS